MPAVRMASEEMTRALRTHVAQQRIVGVTAHEQNLETRALLAQAVRQIAAAHVRHDHIGGQEIDVRRAIVNQAKRFGSIAGGHHGEPVVAKTASQEMSNRLLVLDEENRLRTARTDVSRRRRSDRVCLVDEWKRDRKSRPFALLTVHFDIPAALLHEAVHHGETESRPLADSLRREEGLDEASESEVHHHDRFGCGLDQRSIAILSGGKAFIAPRVLARQQHGQHGDPHDKLKDADVWNRQPPHISKDRRNRAQHGDDARQYDQHAGESIAPPGTPSDVQRESLHGQQQGVHRPGQVRARVTVNDAQRLAPGQLHLA